LTCRERLRGPKKRQSRIINEHFKKGGASSWEELSVREDEHKLPHPKVRKARPGDLL